MRRIFRVALVAALLAGCGAGGTGGIIEKPTPGTPTLEIGTQGASAATVLYAVDVTVQLPAGVTVQADPVTGEVTSGTLLSRVDGALAGGHFYPATATAPARLQLQVADAGGFTVGNLVAVTCQTAAGPPPTDRDFRFDDFSARDANGAALSGISPHLAFQQ